MWVGRVCVRDGGLAGVHLKDIMVSPRFGSPQSLILSFGARETWEYYVVDNGLVFLVYDVDVGLPLHEID